MGMGGNENSTFSHFQSDEEKQPVSGATLASRRTVAHSTVVAHQLRSVVSLTLRDLCDPEDDQQQSRSELEEYVNLNGNGTGVEWE